MLKTLDWRESFNLQSIIKKPSWHDLLDMDPLMIIGYAVIGGTGIMAIIVARIEQKLAKQDNEHVEAVGLLFKALLMAGGVMGAIYYIIVKNPLWRFIRG